MRPTRALGPTDPVVAEDVADRVERAIASRRIDYVGGASELERIEALIERGHGRCGGGRRIVAEPDEESR